jgi:hypothetical protein
VNEVSTGRARGRSESGAEVSAMKKKLPVLVAIVVMLGVFASAAARAQAARSARPEDVSREFEYVESIIRKGVSDGDAEMLTRAHRTISNLELAIDSIEKPEDRILFMLAAGYDYVEMCPTATALSLTNAANPTGFAFNCVEQAEYYFNKAKSAAENQNGFSPATIGDVTFLIGIGYDRMKYKMAGLGVETKHFFDLEKTCLRKAAELGTGFDGVRAMLGLLSGDEYQTKQVMDDDKYAELRRMLYLSHALPQPAEDASTAAATSTITPLPDMDENSYIDYQWRFSVRKPDKTWQFAIRKSSNSFHLTVRKKNPADLEGSGLNIVCRALTEPEAQMPRDQLIGRSIELLKEAGYDIKSQMAVTHNGVPAQEIISAHQYNELIQKTAPESGQQPAGAAAKLVSKQYMIIAVLNNIEYIISFSSLEADYSKVFVEYRMIANTVNIF